MGSISFQNDSFDAMTIKIEKVGKVVHGFSAGPKFFNFLFLLWGELSSLLRCFFIKFSPFSVSFKCCASLTNTIKPRLISAMSPFLLFVSHVIGKCPKKKMLWVNARRIVASMEYAHIFRDWAISKFPRNTVSKNFSISSSTAYHPVSMVVFVSCP